MNRVIIAFLLSLVLVAPAYAGSASMQPGDKSDVFINSQTVLEEVTRIEQIRPRGWEKWTPKKGDHFISEYLRSDVEWHYYRALRLECCTGVCRNRLRGEFRIKRRVTEVRERQISQVGQPVRFRVEFEEQPPPPAEVSPPPVPPTVRPGPFLGVAEGNNRPGFAPERRSVSTQHAFWQRRIRVTALGGNASAASSSSASASAAAAASAGEVPPPTINLPVDAAGAGATAPPGP